MFRILNFIFWKYFSFSCWLVNYFLLTTRGAKTFVWSLALPFWSVVTTSRRDQLGSAGTNSCYVFGFKDGGERFLQILDRFRSRTLTSKTTWKWRGPAKLLFRFSLGRRPRPRQDVNRVVFTSSSERQSFLCFLLKKYYQGHHKNHAILLSI